MSSHSAALNRRTFLRTSAALAGSSLLAPSLLPAIEPIKRTAGPRFKFSLAAYSYREFLELDKGKMTFHDFIDDAAKMNLDGVELTAYYFPRDLTPEYVREVKQHCFLEGLDVSGMPVRNNFCLPAGEKRVAMMETTKRWIDTAEILGAPVIRIFAGKVADDQSPDEAHRLMVSGIEECCEYAGKHGIYLALENHGGPTATAKELLAIVRDVQSPWFGVNMDSGNFNRPTCYEELAEIAPYAINVQIKASMQPEKGKKEPADFGRIAKIVRDAGYRGYIVLEFEDKGDPRTVCPPVIERLREAFA